MSWLQVVAVGKEATITPLTCNKDALIGHVKIHWPIAPSPTLKVIIIFSLSISIISVDEILFSTCNKIYLLLVYREGVYITLVIIFDLEKFYRSIKKPKANEYR